MDLWERMPNYSTRGKSWDAKHLDQLLSSPWGQKLLKNKETPSTVFHQTNGFNSPEFKSPSRDCPAPLSFVLDGGHLGPVKSNRPSTGVPANRMKQIEETVAVLQKQEDTHYLHPEKRRNLAVSKIQLRKEYSCLKQDRLEHIKQARVLRNWYPDPKDHSSRHSQWNQLMSKHMHSSNNMFDGSRPADTQGKKRLDDSQPQHYHDTHKALFAWGELRPSRTYRTPQRQSDIISGAACF